MAQSQRYEISMWFQRLSVLTRQDFWEEVATLQSVDYVVELSTSAKIHLKDEQKAKQRRKGPKLH